MDRLGLIVNFTKPHAQETVVRLAHLATQIGITLMAAPEVCALDQSIQPWHNPQAVISLGGDGSLLSVAHRLDKDDLPIIGFNIGTLGYLTAVNEADFERALTALASDHYHIHPRSTLSARIIRAGCDNDQVVLTDALNDVVISRTNTPHAVDLTLSLNGQPITTYSCDGIVVSTPTGSTAYSLAVGGPILISGSHATVITTIAAHALTARPIVVPNDTPITIALNAEDECCTVSSDGQQSFILYPGDEVHISHSSHSVPLIVLDGDDPFTLLSKKLGWGKSFNR